MAPLMKGRHFCRKAYRLSAREREREPEPVRGPEPAPQRDPCRGQREPVLPEQSVPVQEPVQRHP